MKKYILIIMTIVLISVFVFSNSKNPEISIVVYDTSNPYMDDYSQEIYNQLGSNVDAELYNGKDSQIIQNQIIIDQVETSDLMIINPVDRLSSYVIINKLKSSDVPIVFYNREPLKEDLELYDKAYYVGSNPAQSGQLQAKLVMELFGNDSNNLNKYDLNDDGLIQAIILKGERGHQDAEIRTLSVIEELESQNFKVDLLDVRIGDWKSDDAEIIIREMLGSGLDIEIIISNNDSMALGAVDALLGGGYVKDTNNDNLINMDDEGWIPIVGIDGIEKARSAIQDKLIYGTITNDSLTQSKAIAELSNCILKNTDLGTMNYKIEDDKYIWIDYRILDFNEDLEKN